MGGGDLNSKKAWHPNTLKNQERVWKAEQAAAEEKKRIVELERERQLERERSELNKLAKTSLGSTSSNNDDRLHWMYEKPDKKVQQEEYLLGRAIDKNHEQAGKSELDEIPAVSRRVVGSSMLTIAGDAQVDLVRKIREDPLLLVKERERAARAALLNNPVQRARLTELLRKEQENKKESKSKKKKKKDKDLDNMLTEKLQALGGKKGIDLATLLASDDSSSDSSEKKSKKKKKKKKKEKKSKSKKDMSSDSSETEEEKHSKHDSRKIEKELNKQDSKKKRKSTNESDDNSKKKRKRSEHSVEKKKSKVDNSKHPRDSSDDYQSNDEVMQSRNYQKLSSKYSKFEQQPKYERYWKSDGQTHNDHYSRAERQSSHASFSRDNHQSRDKSYLREERTRDDEYSREDHRTRNSYKERHHETMSSSNDKEWKNKKRSGLSVEEKAAKLAEMVAAGVEREKQRERRVAQQLLEKDKDDRPPIGQSRSRNLINQLPDSLESRIHSNRHYIQRDQRHMNENFARR